MGQRGRRVRRQPVEVVEEIDVNTKTVKIIEGRICDLPRSAFEDVPVAEISRILNEMGY